MNVIFAMINSIQLKRKNVAFVIWNAVMSIYVKKEEKIKNGKESVIIVKIKVFMKII